MGSHAPVPTAVRVGALPKQHMRTIVFRFHGQPFPRASAARQGVPHERRCCIPFRSTGSRSLWRRRVAGRTRKTRQASVASLRSFPRMASWRPPSSRAILSPRVLALSGRWGPAPAARSVPRPRAAPRGAVEQETRVYAAVISAVAVFSAVVAAAAASEC
jgi:hypothetical protein